jgi:transcription antitermination factor NusG
VARFVRFGHDFATIPECVIGSIMDNESSTIEKYINASKFKKGDKLAITSGPLKDVNVCFEHYTADERVVVLFSMLNQKQKTTIEKSQVVKI